MANFFLDNEDIQFLFNHIDLAELARLQEDDFAAGAETATTTGPLDAADAVDNYRRILEIIGEMAGEMIAPNAEPVDREGNTLNDDGTVTLHPLVRQNLSRLTQADLMGFTLPRKYGGLNCPSLVYTMANEIDQPGRLLADEPVRAARHRRDDLRLRQRRDQRRVLPRFCRGEVTGAMVLTEPDAGSDLQAVRLRAYQDAKGQLASQRREAVHHQRLRRSAAGARPQRAGNLRRPRLESVHHRAERTGPRAAPGKQARHPRLAHLRTGFRRYALPAHRRAAAGPDHLRDGADERRPGGHRRAVAGRGRGRLRLARTYAHTRQQFGGPSSGFPPSPSW